MTVLDRTRLTGPLCTFLPTASSAAAPRRRALPAAEGYNGAAPSPDDSEPPCPSQTSPAHATPAAATATSPSSAAPNFARGGSVFGAPVVLVVCARTGDAWVRRHDGMNSAHIDTSIVCDQMMMQATELGLGTCWVCMFDPEQAACALALPARPIPAPERNGPAGLLLRGPRPYLLNAM